VPDRPVVLFLCVHNSGRSVAGRVLLDHYAEGRIEVLSAGSEPADRLNPAVVAVLAERGLDVGAESPHPMVTTMSAARAISPVTGFGDS
jgi:arsenate reductase